MEKETLIKRASQISKVSEDSLKEYVDKIEILAAKMNEVMLNRGDILELIGGEKNITIMKDNHNNHLRYIASIMETPDPESMVDTVLWVFRSYMSIGFSSSYWPVQISTWIPIIKENVSEKAFSEIFSTYDWFTVNIPYFATSADEKLEKSKHMDH